MSNSLDESQINYTNLICVAIKANDLAAIKCNLSRALKKGVNLDFNKIANAICPNGRFAPGANALSCVLLLLPIYDLDRYLKHIDSRAISKVSSSEVFEEELISLVKIVIELSDQDVIMSESVKRSVYERIKPGYPQIIYNEILLALSKKGFVVDDYYFSESLTFLQDSITREYLANPWEYLYNLYSNFVNRVVGTNLNFPCIKRVKDIEYGTVESYDVLALIIEHLKRNFAVFEEDVHNPKQMVNSDRTALQTAQDILLTEIVEYVGYLDYRQVMAIIDNCPIIDVEAMNRNFLLQVALKIHDVDLSRELIKRGATIITHNKNGHDITAYICDAEQISLFESLKTSSELPDQLSSGEMDSSRTRIVSFDKNSKKN